MHYNWKDVRNNVVVEFFSGVLLAAIAYFIGKGLASSAPHSNPKMMHDLLVFNLVLWMGGWTLLLNAISFWDTGVSVWYHGWKLKTADVIGCNVGFIMPFVLTIWLA